MQHGIRPRTGLGTVVCAGLWLAATGAAAQVSLSDGLWSTSFIGCPTGDLGAGDVCDGLRAVSPEYVCGSSPARHSQIASEANYPGGAGGNGFALYYEGNARNIFSTGLLLEMSPPQPELWLRFYRMWPVGQTWGGILEHKIIYLFTDAGVALNINYPQGEDDIGVQPRNTMGSPDLYYPGNGWRTLNGGELVGDGAWHAFEIHVRLGTAGANDGLFEMWIDGEPVVSITGMDFFDGGARSPTGFSEVELPSNHNVSTLAGCAESRVDDIALAVPGYAGFTLDPQGRSMIGLLGARPAPADAGMPGTDGGPPPIGADAGASDAGGARADAAVGPPPAGGCACVVAVTRKPARLALVLPALALLCRRRRGSRDRDRKVS